MNFRRLFRPLLTGAALLMIVALAPLAATAAGAPVGKVAFQGLLKQGSTPASGTLSLTFRLYTVASGGAAIWTETQNVTVANGIYSVNLGEVTTLGTLAFDAPYWLSTQVGSDAEMSPRVELASVPYAFTAGSANTVADASITAAKIGANCATGEFLIKTASGWACGGKQSATYRWAVWSTYDQSSGWIAGNDPNLFGGINPSSWSDGSAVASSLSSDKNVLGTLFNNRKVVSPNSLVVADTWYNSSSTNGKHAAALFRVRNNTGSAVTWNVTFVYSQYTGWAEVASATLNGAATWTGASTSCTSATGGASCTQSLALSIPANRVSTFVVVAGSGQSSGTRSLLLAFTGSTLTLPAGLEFVDDLDASTGSAWTQ